MERLFTFISTGNRACRERVIESSLHGLGVHGYREAVCRS